VLCVKHIHQDSSCFLACEIHQKAGGICWQPNLAPAEVNRSGLYSPSRIRVFCKESSCNPTREGVRLPRSINIKAKAYWGKKYTQSNQYKNHITFISQTLAFSNPRLLSSFVPAAFEDVLSGLPTSEQPYDHELWRGPSRARCSRSSRVPCLHRSDRSAKPVRPVHPGFSLCRSFWWLLRVLAHSNALAQFCVNSYNTKFGERLDS